MNMPKRVYTFAMTIAAVAVLAVSVSCETHRIQTTPHGARPTATGRVYAYAGFPRGHQEILVLRNQGFVVGYSEQRRDPLWVCYRVFRVGTEVLPDRPSRFLVDDRTRSRVPPEAYAGSGYDRGHMAPNFAIATRYGQAAQAETFLMSNIVPQAPRLNRGMWQRLEMLASKTYAPRCDEVWIIAGPVFDRNIQALRSGVEIPDACYQIILDELNDRPRVLAFVIPQDVPLNARLEDYLRSVDDVEAMAGLDFLSELPDELEGSLEAQRPTTLWNPN